MLYERIIFAYSFLILLPLHCCTENTTETNKFLAHFQKCLRDLKPNNYNNAIHKNIELMVGKMIDKRRILLNDYYKIKEKISKEKMDDDQGKYGKLENRMAKLTAELTAEKSEKQKLNDKINKINADYFNNSRQLKSEIATLQSSLKASEDRSQELKNNLEHSMKQNFELLDQIKLLIEDKEELNRKCDLLDQYNTSFANCVEERDANQKEIEKKEIQIEKKDLEIKEKNKELEIMIEKIKEWENKFEKIEMKKQKFIKQAAMLWEDANATKPNSDEPLVTSNEPISFSSKVFEPTKNCHLDSSKMLITEPPSKRQKVTPATSGIRFSNSVPFQAASLQQSHDNDIPLLTGNQYCVSPYSPFQHSTLQLNHIPYSNLPNQENYGNHIPQFQLNIDPEQNRFDSNVVNTHKKL
uniref:Uncharacterized protein n=1 Tax=Panagrolaimus superbus TaxID=310955 RepID=A0A914XVA3_9BILA